MIQDKTSTGATRASASVQEKPGWDSISSRTNVDLGAVSHQGKVRPDNEDSFLVMRFERSLRSLLTNLPPDQIPDLYCERGYAMFVADGMGGMLAGEVASRTAIGTLVELIIQTPDWIMRPDEQKASEVLRRMEERFGKLTDALTERAQSEPNLDGMGTTLTLAVSLGADLAIAHVGASRAYLFRQRRLLHLTTDQTIAQLLADAGVIRPEDVAKHHARRVLTGAITAAGEKAEVELHYVKLMDGDQLLLCSDGLTEMVTDSKISEALEKSEPAADTCRALVEMALEAGGHDNVTVILGRYRIPQE
ncbi:MAG TPA: protein phosphatase 2C domain-containing protein [Pyrinomonadaceae bacterium]|jgi:protein phosphatase